MRDYYEILGVRRNASNAEIKRSFRRLANIYHPDRNSSKDAESIIKDVIEAYSVLDDPQQRALYDGLLNKQDPVITVNPGNPHRDPRYRYKKPDPNYRSPKQQTLDLMQEWLPVSLHISQFTLIICVILSFDLTLSPKTRTDTVIVGHGAAYQRNGEDRVYTKEGKEYVIGRGELSNFRRGVSITISSSRLLGVPLKLTRNDSRVSASIPATIYGNFIFAPVVLTITSLLGVFWKKGIMFRFNLGVVNALIFFLNVIFLLVGFTSLK